MRGLRAAAADPWVVSVTILVAIAGAGFLGIGLGWRGAAAQVDMADQLTYVVSGGAGGIAVLGFALAVLGIQGRRRTEARRRAELDRVIGAVAGLAAAVRGEVEE